jgi:protein-disulfide isomerase
MTKVILILGFLSASPFAVAFADEPSSNSAVVLEINGKKFTFSEFEQKRPAALFQARNTFYQSARKAADEFVDSYLLEQQAEAEHLTVAELLERHVNSAIEKDPPEDALRVYYEGVDTTEPFEAVRPQILERVRQRRMDKAKAAYLKTLHSQANIAIRMAPPRASISLKDTPLRGHQDAPVMIIEYADYECPYCQQIQPVLDKVEAEYKGKVALAYKDAPLPMHPHAQKAGEAARCAGAQGKYWEYHDLLFATKALEIPQLKEGAATLKLDTQVFDKCLSSGEQEKAVKTQLAEAQTFQLQGTPSFFINGIFFSGSLTYEQFRAILDEELAAAPAPKVSAEGSGQGSGPK